MLCGHSLASVNTTQVKMKLIINTSADPTSARELTGNYEHQLRIHIGRKEPSRAKLWAWPASIYQTVLVSWVYSITKYTGYPWAPTLLENVVQNDSPRPRKSNDGKSHTSQEHVSGTSIWKWHPILKWYECVFLIYLKYYLLYFNICNRCKTEPVFT